MGTYFINRYKQDSNFIKMDQIVEQTAEKPTFIHSIEIPENILETYKNQHFGIIPAIEMISIIQQSFLNRNMAINWKAKDFGIIFSDIEYKSQISEGLINFGFINPETKKFTICAEITHLKGGSQKDINVNQIGPTKTQNPDKEALPHKDEWNLVESETPVKSLNNIGTFSINLSSKKINSHKKNGKLCPIILQEIAAQNMAAILLEKGQTPMFRSIKFEPVNEKSIDLFDTAKKIKVQYSYNIKRGTNMMARIDFINSETDEIIFKGSFNAVIVPQEIFESQIETAYNETQSMSAHVSKYFQAKVAQV